MYKQILQGLLKNFFVTKGRAPITLKEWAKLKNQAKSIVKQREKTAPFEGFTPKMVPKDGIPSITKNTTIEDLMTGPHMSDGPKGQRVWDFSQKRGEVIPFPDKGIRSLIKN